MRIADNQDSRINWAFFIRLYMLQLGLTVTVTIVSAFVAGIGVGISAFAGGIIATLPHMLVAALTFINERKSQSMHQVVAGFYKAELYKFIYTAMLFAMAFKFIDRVNPLSLILTFIVVQSLSWIAPLILKHYWFKK